MNEIYSLILNLLTAAVIGAIGSFALMKQMTLAGDVFSHVALPGLGIAILLQINPLLGAAVSLIIGVILVWKLEKSTALSSETAIGVIFAGALAVGTLITPGEELIDALFGGFEKLTPAIFILSIAIIALIVIFIIKFKNQLIISLFSKDIAIASKINISRLNFLYMLSFALTILLGLRLLGAILVGALVIIPAATARQLTHNFKFFITLSCIFSVISVVIGYFLNQYYSLPLGPIIVTIASALFVMSLIIKRD